MPSYVIAGASRGLGLQFIKSLSTNPANIVIALARTPANVRHNLPDLPNIHLLQADLTTPDSLRAAASATAKITSGALDVLIVNGAWIDVARQAIPPTGFSTPEKEEQLLSDMNAAFKTNFAGPLFCINAFLPLVLEGKGKKIVVISSGMADTEFVLKAGVWAGLTYSASKAAANVLVAKTAAESKVKEKGVTVVSLSPGLVDVDGTEESKKNFDMLVPMFRGYEPGFTGPITPVESVELMMKVIEGLTMEHSGRMWSHLGTQRWI